MFVCLFVRKHDCQWLLTHHSDHRIDDLSFSSQSHTNCILFYYIIFNTHSVTNVVHLDGTLSRASTTDSQVALCCRTVGSFSNMSQLVFLLLLINVVMCPFAELCLLLLRVCCPVALRLPKSSSTPARMRVCSWCLCLHGWRTHSRSRRWLAGHLVVGLLDIDVSVGCMLLLTFFLPCQNHVFKIISTPPLSRVAASLDFFFLFWCDWFLHCHYCLNMLSDKVTTVMIAQTQLICGKILDQL